MKSSAARTLADLKTFIGTKNDVSHPRLLRQRRHGSRGFQPDFSRRKVVVLTAGKFGERWRDLAKAYGCQIELVKCLTARPSTCAKSRRSSRARACFTCRPPRTSTGARHDVKAIAALLKGTDTLLVVDAITGLGTTHFDVDNWGIDVLIGGSQKAVMIPPGLAYLSVSERAWQRMETAKQPRYYFDLRKERKSAAKGESAFTRRPSRWSADWLRRWTTFAAGQRQSCRWTRSAHPQCGNSAAMVRAGVKAWA